MGLVVVVAKAAEGRSNRTGDTALRILGTAVPAAMLKMACTTRPMCHVVCIECSGGGVYAWLGTMGVRGVMVH